MEILINLFLNTLIIIAGAYVIPGISLDNFVTALLVAFVFALLNTFIKPIVKLLALPITILTLGLFALVINALFVLLVSALVPGFHVDGFWSAFFFAIFIWLLGTILRLFI